MRAGFWKACSKKIPRDDHINYEPKVSGKASLEIWQNVNNIVACHLPGAPSYGGVRTWVEGSQMRGDRALARASNLPGYKEYTQLPITVLYTLLTDYLFPYKTNERVGRDNIYLHLAWNSIDWPGQKYVRLVFRNLLNKCIPDSQCIKMVTYHWPLCITDWPHHDMSSNVTMLNWKIFYDISWHPEGSTRSEIHQNFYD